MDAAPPVATSAWRAAPGTSPRAAWAAVASGVPASAAHIPPGVPTTASAEEIALGTHLAAALDPVRAGAPWGAASSAGDGGAGTPPRMGASVPQSPSLRAARMDAALPSMAPLPGLHRPAEPWGMAPLPQHSLPMNSYGSLWTMPPGPASTSAPGSSGTGDALLLPPGLLGIPPVAATATPTKPPAPSAGAAAAAAATAMPSPYSLKPSARVFVPNRLRSDEPLRPAESGAGPLAEPALAEMLGAFSTGPSAGGPPGAGGVPIAPPTIRSNSAPVSFAAPFGGAFDLPGLGVPLPGVGAERPRAPPGMEGMPLPPRHPSEGALQAGALEPHVAAALPGFGGSLGRAVSDNSTLPADSFVPGFGGSPWDSFGGAFSRDPVAPTSATLPVGGFGGAFALPFPPTVPHSGFGPPGFSAPASVNARAGGAFDSRPGLQ